ncbi:MAG: hypothetical protein AAGF75_06265 [Cyanobacteria bacterium P01_H01_bin.130]
MVSSPTGKHFTRHFKRDRLQTHLSALGVATAANPFGQLALVYGSPSRHYHNAQHIEACLGLLAQYGAIAIAPHEIPPSTTNFHEIAIALWFHDAIYDPRRLDNEQASAAWAGQFLSSQGVARPAIERIINLILATQTHRPPTQDARLMLDIDLAILGSDRPTYETYTHNIRREYNWLSAANYRAGRAQFLQTYLARPTLFHTAPFQKRYENQARENMARELEGLTSP